uniref:Uncharacterized protein n=1 Tax=Chlamydomonas euryale TaxID=1486919 RepID=A0A7R9Z1B0_9CHLO|mmetsp:Transcript_37690/g.111579  ORF Transcript_37690/g.111579 Transcript_37690/m.111579 type:complete len:160 (+) Transcript_37690:448-927(+)|eukprot:349741-Chlamydomonas_euryale.AAC.13
MASPTQLPLRLCSIVSLSLRQLLLLPPLPVHSIAAPSRPPLLPGRCRGRRTLCGASAVPRAWADSSPPQASVAARGRLSVAGRAWVSVSRARASVAAKAEVFQLLPGLGFQLLPRFGLQPLPEFGFLLLPGLGFQLLPRLKLQFNWLHLLPEFGLQMLP